VQKTFNKHLRGTEMNIVRILVAAMLVVGFIGCGLGDDEGAQEAIKLVQDFKPSTSGSSVVQTLKTAFTNDDWSVTKTSESFYHVIYRGSASGRAKELVFGVNINKRHVMALNKDALAYTNPM